MVIIDHIQHCVKKLISPIVRSSVVDPNHVDADPDPQICIRKNGSGSADPHQEKTDPDPALGERFL